MADNFPKLMKHMKPQIQKAKRTPTKINTKISTLRQIIQTAENKTKKKS